MHVFSEITTAVWIAMNFYSQAGQRELKLRSRNPVLEIPQRAGNRASLLSRLPIQRLDTIETNLMKNVRQRGHNFSVVDTMIIQRGSCARRHPVRVWRGTFAPARHRAPEIH